KREALQTAEDALDHWAQGLAKITATDLDVVLSGLGDVTGEDFDVKAMLEKGITIQPGKQGGKIVGSVLAEGEIGPGAGVARLEGVAGKIFYSDKLIDFTGLTIENFYGEDITFIDDKHEARTRGRTGFIGLTLSGSIKLREELNENLDWTKTLDELRIRNFYVKALYARGIDVRTPDFTLNLPDGYLNGLYAEGFTFTPALGLLPDDSSTTTGSLGLAAFRLKQLGLTVGKTLALGGTFRGRGLSIDMVSANRRIIRLADLDANSAKVLLPGPGIRVHFNTHGLSLHVEQVDDRIIVHRVKVGDLTLANSYISAAGTVIDVRKQAVMRGVHATAEVNTYKKKDGSMGV